MGKKTKNIKKGKGIEKTAEKTAKNLKHKLKKDLGEDDVESIVKAIEEEEKKMKETKVENLILPPTHRANFSFSYHPNAPELILFGGEFFNGQKTVLYNELLFYDTKRHKWSRVISPGSPSPRSSHQAVVCSRSGGQLWIFGGEFSSQKETQFYHYKDLWCFHLLSRQWEKVMVPGGPSSRSGHRMILLKHFLLIFGGFHDNTRDSKYFNDVFTFNLEDRVWKKLDTASASGAIGGPSVRSGCCMFSLSDGRVVVYGGYSRTKKTNKKNSEEIGVTHSDMFILAPDKHDPSFTKWRWQIVKQLGSVPSPRCGMSAVSLDENRALLFGGVEDAAPESDDDEDGDYNADGNFFNDLYLLEIVNERAYWNLICINGNASKLDIDGQKLATGTSLKEYELQVNDERLKDMKIDEQPEHDNDKDVTVVDGAFTITSSISKKPPTSGDAVEKRNELSNGCNRQWIGPCPRFGAGLSIKHGRLYVYGGTVEQGQKTITLNDLYSIDIRKFDSWNALIESDHNSMEWLESESESETSESETNSSDIMDQS